MVDLRSVERGWGLGTAGGKRGWLAWLYVFTEKGEVNVLYGLLARKEIVKKGFRMGRREEAGAAGVGWHTERRRGGQGGHADLLSFL